MSFIGEVADKSCFAWERHSADDEFDTEYTLAGFSFEMDEKDLTLYKSGNGYFASIYTGFLPSSVVASVIDTLVKNYREEVA